MRTEKTIPAIAAARGVFKRALIKSASCFINFLRGVFLAIALESGTVFEGQDEETRAPREISPSRSRSSELSKKVLVHFFQVQSLIDPNADVVPYHQSGELFSIDKDNP